MNPDHRETMSHPAKTQNIVSQICGQYCRITLVLDARDRIVFAWDKDAWHQHPAMYDRLPKRAAAIRLPYRDAQATFLSIELAMLAIREGQYSEVTLDRVLS